jgi:hypothetical protein
MRRARLRPRINTTLPTANRGDGRGHERSGVADAAPRATSPGGHPGATTESSAPGSTPTAGSREVTCPTGPSTPTLQPATEDQVDTERCRRSDSPPDVARAVPRLRSGETKRNRPAPSRDLVCAGGTTRNGRGTAMGASGGWTSTLLCHRSWALPCRAIRSRCNGRPVAAVRAGPCGLLWSSGAPAASSAADRAPAAAEHPGVDRSPGGRVFAMLHGELIAGP